MRITPQRLLSLVGAILLATCGATPAQERPAAPPLPQERPPATNPAQANAGQWRPMFDGKTLTGWKESPFAARGKVTIENGTIVLGYGYMTGITWTGQFPKADYEVRYEARRVEGTDFFGALTFPVRDSFCTFINGGWGGEVVGLSSLDSMDASENETSVVRSFTNGRWYAFRVRVADWTIEAWIDGEKVIDVDVRGREVSLRPGEIENAPPLGIASYRSVAEIRNIEYRLLNPPDPNGGRVAREHSEVPRPAHL